MGRWSKIVKGNNFYQRREVRGIPCYSQHVFLVSLPTRVELGSCFTLKCQIKSSVASVFEVLSLLTLFWSQVMLMVMC